MFNRKTNMLGFLSNHVFQWAVNLERIILVKISTLLSEKPSLRKYYWTVELVGYSRTSQ